MAEKTTLKLEGMSCAGCAQTIETALKKAGGVMGATVNFAAEKAYVEFDPAATNIQKLADIVRDAGYDVKQEGDQKAPAEEDEDERKMALTRRRMWGAWVFTIPIIAWMIPDMFFGITWPTATAMDLGIIEDNY